jgi:uncharacterized protein involved in cysteine biosynthesis
MSIAAALERPGFLRRAAAGAWHVPAGFLFLLKNPTLWGLALLPSLLACGLGLTGFVSSWYLLPRLDATLAPSVREVGEVLSVGASVVLGLLTLITGVLLGLGLALLLTAPLLDLLSQRTERRVRGFTADEGRGTKFEVVQSLKGAFTFALAVPVAFLIGLIPFVGPPFALLWGAYALAFQLTDGPLARRGLGFEQKHAFHRYWWLESVGFGLLGLLALLVPLANLLLVPALTVGATRLVLELDEASGKKPVGQEERAPREV